MGFSWPVVNPYFSSSPSIIESVTVGGAESGVDMTSDMDFEWLRE